VGSLYSAPTLGDLDGDGDLDLVSGEYFGSFLYFENTGSATSPAFVGLGFAGNPLFGRDVGDESMPTLGDVDGDGDLDLVSGEYFGSFLYFENTGSATSPAFVERSGTANPLDGETVGAKYSTPVLGDVDGDGDLDLVSGEQYGSFRYFENSIVQPSLSVNELTGAENPLDGEDVGDFSTPTFGDLNGDGIPDLVTGNAIANFWVMLGNANMLGLLHSYSSGVLLTAGLPLTEIAGSEISAQGFVTETPIDVGDDSAPVLADLDGDGDRDLLTGDALGGFHYFENTGDATSWAFAEATGAANPLDGVDLGDDSTPSLGDLDGDGDLDLLAGEYDGVFNFFENTGSAENPAFVEVTGTANPLDGEDVGDLSTPSLGDADGDGDLDLVAGDGSGVFHYFENTGSLTSPAFVERMGAANPFDGQSVGLHSAPAFADLDGDGDLDLAAGENLGTFHVYVVPEPGQGLMLGAGIALLKLLERLRRRRS